MDPQIYVHVHKKKHSTWYQFYAGSSRGVLKSGTFDCQSTDLVAHMGRLLHHHKVPLLFHTLTLGTWEPNETLLNEMFSCPSPQLQQQQQQQQQQHFIYTEQYIKFHNLL